MTETHNIAAESLPDRNPSARGLVPWILFLIFFAVLNETVFNVSTPRIAQQFGLGPSGITWMMTVFMVIFGMGSVIYGKLADVYSLRNLISLGVILYSAGSLVGFFFQAFYPLVILGRAIQGAGASAIPALIFVVVARYFPAGERGRIFGLITSVVSLSIGLGPVIGGFVSSTLHWSWLFLIPVLTLVSLPFLRRLMPEESQGKSSLDVPGGLLVAVFVGSLVVFMNQGEWLWVAVLVAAGLGAVLWFRRAKDPFINPLLFANAGFRRGVVAGFILFSLVMGILFLLPLMLHGVHGVDSSGIGLILFPGAMSSVFFGPLGGRLADRYGSRTALALGLGLVILGLVTLAGLLSLSPWVSAVALFFIYVGFSFFQTALVNSVSQTLMPHETGVGMGVFNLVSIISGALGTALVGKILESRGLDFGILPVLGTAGGEVYRNLFAIFALGVLATGLWYLGLGLGKNKRKDEQTVITASLDPPAKGPSSPEPCPECGF